ncbi:hypothetical protein GLU26_00960 [Nanohaloarchaea archaeon]|nr:hypothetical protein [Candidatus Nanohaloarchaea archaeon]
MSPGDDMDWMVFQRDVLDVLRQYRGYFDLTERIGSLKDSSRPDFVGRTDREDKKEVWVVDAKSKRKISESDLERMRKYIEMLKSNPIDLGLEIGELNEYKFRGIFVTRSREPDNGVFECLKFSSLHQFLQNELVYTDTESVVRDVAKMMQRKQLSQSQARLLHRSIKPFQRTRENVLDRLEEIKSGYIGLKIRKPPFDTKLPVEALLEHDERPETFMIDIPYSRDALDNIEEKIDTIRTTLTDDEENVYFIAVNTFDQTSNSDYICSVQEFGEELSSIAGILSVEDVADLFTPKVSSSRSWEDGFLRIEGVDDRFAVRIYTDNDIQFRVEADIPEESISRIKNMELNSGTQLGMVDEDVFELEFEIGRNQEIQLGEEKLSLQNFKDRVRAIYQSSVNPVLSQTVTNLAADTS